jgi:hypothetical protein
MDNRSRQGQRDLPASARPRRPTSDAAALRPYPGRAPAAVGGGERVQQVAQHRSAGGTDARGKGPADELRTTHWLFLFGNRTIGALVTQRRPFGSVDTGVGRPQENTFNRSIEYAVSIALLRRSYLVYGDSTTEHGVLRLDADSRILPDSIQVNDRASTSRVNVPTRDRRKENGR